MFCFFKLFSSCGVCRVVCVDIVVYACGVVMRSCLCYLCGV